MEAQRSRGAGRGESTAVQGSLTALSCACGVVVKLVFNSGIEPSGAAMIVS